MHLPNCGHDHKITRKCKTTLFMTLILFVAVLLVVYNFRVSYWWTLIVDRHLPRFHVRFRNLVKFASDSTSASASESSPPTRLLLNTSGCTIPSFDPWDSSLMPFVDNRSEGQVCHGYSTHVRVHLAMASSAVG